MVAEDKVRYFVQNMLGCGCPEEVFAKIECSGEVSLDDTVLLNEKIKVGSRLLIYIIEANDIDDIVSKIPGLLLAGKNERDNMGFNRFRLVIATDKISELKAVSESLLASFKEKDERVHLHIIDKLEYQIL